MHNIFQHSFAAPLEVQDIVPQNLLEEEERSTKRKHRITIIK